MNPNYNPNALGLSELLARNLKFYRSTLEYTQDEVAEAAGITTSLWSSYENGRGNPTLTQLEKLSKALLVPVSSLLQQEPNLSESNIRIIPLVEEFNKLTTTKQNLFVKIIRLLISISD